MGKHLTILSKTLNALHPLPKGRGLSAEKIKSFSIKNNYFDSKHLHLTKISSLTDPIRNPLGGFRLNWFNDT